MDWLLGQLAKEKSMISGAPIIFAFTWAIGSILIWFVLEKYVYRSRLEAKDDLIRVYREKLGILPDSKSTSTVEKPKALLTSEQKVSKLNIVFSHCKQDATSISEHTLCRIWMAEFINNNTPSRGDQAQRVVARLEYFKIQTVSTPKDLLVWKTNQGLWKPGESNYFDFLTNKPGRLVLAALVDDGYRKEKLCAVGYRDVDELNPFTAELCVIEDHLPVIVHVILLASNVQKDFKFKIEKTNDNYFFTSA